ncbi:Ig-like domain-containing protein [Labilithrix luteola]|nr:Ig-like domain-containing protein [Labilithrix luteola]
MTRNVSPAARLAFVGMLSCALVSASFVHPAFANGVDTCGSPAPVLTTAGDTGDTTGKANDIASVPLGCNGNYLSVAGPEVLYRLILGTGNAVTITVTPSAGYDPSIYLLSTCGDGATCGNGWGADKGLAGQAETLTLSGVPAGIYYLAVDSFFPASDPQSKGTFTITATGNFGTMATTTTLTSSAAPSMFGQSVTFSAAVDSTIGAPPIGSVQFQVDGTNTQLVAVDNSGKATYSTSSFAIGSHTVKARYGGQTPFSTSTGQVTQVVSQASSTTTVTSSANPSIATQSVTFTAQVAVPAPGVATPAGTVTFKDGATTLGTGTVDATGKATFTTSNLAVGTHSITASYGGNTNVAASTSAAISQVISAIGAQISLASSANPSPRGSSVTFTSTVTAVGVTANPTGTVRFKDGATTLGTGTLTGGTATYATAALGGGSHTITATYDGDANFSGGETASLMQDIDPTATTTTLAATPNPSTTGAAVTFTATVASGVGTPVGTVTFLEGTATLGTGTLSAGSASFVTSSLTEGPHTVHAEYAGNTDYVASKSAELVQTVNAPVVDPDAGTNDDGGITKDAGGNGDGGSTNDGGSTADGSSSAGDDGGNGSDAGTSSLSSAEAGADDGCGCRTAGAPASTSLFGVFAALGFVVTCVRRRSSARRAS